MDKEAKVLASELYMLDNGRHSVDYDAWAGRIILNGYRKLPKDNMREANNQHGEDTTIQLTQI